MICSYLLVLWSPSEERLDHETQLQPEFRKLHSLGVC